MSDATGQLAEGLHLLGPAQVLSQAEAVRKVLHGGHHGAQPTFFVLDRDVVYLDDPYRPVGSSHPSLARPWLRDGLVGLVPGCGRRRPGHSSVEEVGLKAAVDLLPGPPDDLAQSAVGVGDATVGVQAEDAGRRPVEDTAEPLLAIYQGLLGELLHRDIPDQEADTGRRALPSTDRGEPALEPPGARGDLQAVLTSLRAARLEDMADNSGKSEADLFADPLTDRSPQELAPGRGQ